MSFFCAVMDKIKRPRGLIRYASLNSIERGLAVLFGARDRLRVLICAKSFVELRKSRLHRRVGWLPGRRARSPEAFDRASHAIEQNVDGGAVDCDVRWLQLLGWLLLVGFVCRAGPVRVWRCSRGGRPLVSSRRFA